MQGKITKSWTQISNLKVLNFLGTHLEMEFVQVTSR